MVSGGRRFVVPRYFLFIGGSSTKLTQNPDGLTLEPFFTILIFIVSPGYEQLATACASETTAELMLCL